MTSARTVVGKTQRKDLPRLQPGRAQLHADLMTGWARAAAQCGGKAAFAESLGITVPALDKQHTGSMPGFDLIVAVLGSHPRVLDEVLARMGLRICDNAADCDVDDLHVLLARVLVMVAEAEHPDSPGGRAIVGQEYLKGEDMMRALHAMTGRWLSRCADIRRPTEQG